MVKLRHLFIILAAILFLAGCRSDIAFVEGSFRPGQAEVSLSGSNLSMNFPSSTGSASVDLDATGKWTATFVNERAKDWCTLSTESGSRGKATITVSVKENTDYDQRSASINFICGDVQRTIVVTQKQKDALLVTSNRMDVDYKGGNITVEVKANVEFEYSISESAKSWITQVGTKGLKTSQLLFQVDANEEFEKREGTITITSSAGSETVRVYQEGATPTLIVSTSQIEITAEGTTFQVEVRSNVDVAISIPKSCTWLREIQTKAMSTNTYYFQADANESFNTREATITFKNAAKGMEEKVTVIQAADTPKIIIGQTSYEFGSQGGNFDVEVTSNYGVDVSIPDSCSWIQSVKTKAMTKKTYGFHIITNPTANERSGVILFQNKELSLVDTVHVFQGAGTILLSPAHMEIPGIAGEFNLYLAGQNPDRFSLDCDADWITIQSIEPSEIGLRYKCSLAPQSSKQQREAHILIQYAYLDKPCEVIVTQYALCPTVTYTFNGIQASSPILLEDAQKALIYWGDGTCQPYAKGLIHNYPESGIYTITVTSDPITALRVGNLPNDVFFDFTHLTTE